MALSRKHVKELNRLRSSANDLWAEQRAVFDTAGHVARSAGTQAWLVGREEVAPRVRGVFDSQILPVVASSVSSARTGVSEARHKLGHDVLPAITDSLSSITLLRDAAHEPHVRNAVARLAQAGSKLAQTGSQLTSKAQEIVPVKKSAGPGRYIAVTFGIIGLAVLAYAAWQTLRADDELWVTDDPDETESSPEAVTPATS